MHKLSKYFIAGCVCSAMLFASTGCGNSQSAAEATTEEIIQQTIPTEEHNAKFHDSLKIFTDLQFVLDEEEEAKEAEKAEAEEKKAEKSKEAKKEEKKEAAKEDKNAAAESSTGEEAKEASTGEEAKEASTAEEAKEEKKDAKEEKKDSKKEDKKKESKADKKEDANQKAQEDNTAAEASTAEEIPAKYVITVPLKEIKSVSGKDLVQNMTLGSVDEKTHIYCNPYFNISYPLDPIWTVDSRDQMLVYDRLAVNYVDEKHLAMSLQGACEFTDLYVNMDDGDGKIMVSIVNLREFKNLFQGHKSAQKYYYKKLYSYFTKCGYTDILVTKDAKTIADNEYAILDVQMKDGETPYFIKAMFAKKGSHMTVVLFTCKDRNVTDILADSLAGKVKQEESKKDEKKVDKKEEKKTEESTQEGQTTEESQDQGDSSESTEEAGNSEEVQDQEENSDSENSEGSEENGDSENSEEQ